MSGVAEASSGSRHTGTRTGESCAVSLGQSTQKPLLQQATEMRVREDFKISYGGKQSSLHRHDKSKGRDKTRVKHMIMGNDKQTGTRIYLKIHSQMQNLKQNMN